MCIGFDRPLHRNSEDSSFGSLGSRATANLATKKKYHLRSAAGWHVVSFVLQAFGGPRPCASNSDLLCPCVRDTTSPRLCAWRTTGHPQRCALVISCEIQMFEWNSIGRDTPHIHLAPRAPLGGNWFPLVPSLVTSALHDSRYPSSAKKTWRVFRRNPIPSRLFAVGRTRSFVRL